MLVFFIHGVATQDVKYARSLETLIREEFKKTGKSCPHFYSSFWANSIEKSLRDFVNSQNKVVQAIGLVNPLINEAVALAPMLAGTGDGHTRYWNCSQTAGLITANILGQIEEPGTGKNDSDTIDRVINGLKQVPGMTPHQQPNLPNHILDKTLEEISFKNGSGKLMLTINPLRIHHVYVFDRYDNCKFSGYVGLMHGDGLKKMVESIKNFFC